MILKMLSGLDVRTFCRLDVDCIYLFIYQYVKRCLLKRLPSPSFLLQEIDGKALLLLRSDMMMKYMGLKLGPALKLTFHIDKLKRA